MDPPPDFPTKSNFLGGQIDFIVFIYRDHEDLDWGENIGKVNISITLIIWS